MSKTPKVTPLKGRVDMFDIFQKFKHAVMTEGEDFRDLLDDPDLFGERSNLDIGNIKVSYFEPNTSLMFNCKEGTFFLELCADKETGNDYLYYREPNAKQGAGKGTLVAQISCNGTVLEKMPEIYNTDISPMCDTQKARSFDALFDEFQTFRRLYVPKTVPTEYEKPIGYIIADGRLPTDRIAKMRDISNFCRVLTDEERKIAYKDNAEGRQFRKENDPFYERTEEYKKYFKEEENEPFVPDDDYEPFIIDDDDYDSFIIDNDKQQITSTYNVSTKQANSMELSQIKDSLLQIYQSLNVYIQNIEKSSISTNKIVTPTGYKEKKKSVLSNKVLVEMNKDDFKSIQYMALNVSSMLSFSRNTLKQIHKLLEDF